MTEPWAPTVGWRLTHFSENLAGESPTGVQPDDHTGDPQRENSNCISTSMAWGWLGNINDGPSCSTANHASVSAAESPILARRFLFGASTDLQLANPGNACKWRLVRCVNGLRFFEETSDFPFVYKLPVKKAVGVVKAPADQIYSLIMDYGPERLQWDNTVESGSVIGAIDGHSDILYIRMRQDWIKYVDLFSGVDVREIFAWLGIWKREENGAYCRYINTLCKLDMFERTFTGIRWGYIVTPLKSSTGGKPRTSVEAVLEMDVAGWSSLVGTGLCSYPVHLRDSLLGVVAGIREHVAAQRFNSTVTLVKRHSLNFSEDLRQPSADSETSHVSISNTSFLDIDELEEFFDADVDVLSESSESAQSSLEPVITPSESIKISDVTIPSVSLAHQGRFDIFKFDGSLGRGSLKGGQHSFAEPEGSNFLLKGSNFLSTGTRVPAGEPLCKLVAMDWLKAKDKIDRIAGRPQSLVQKVSSNEDLFFFIINLQVPHTLNYSLVFHYVTNEEIAEGSLVHRFIFGDDTFRNSRLSLIPAIPEGSWIIRHAVGSRTVLVGQILEVIYHVGSNYMEIDLNLGSSGVVRGIMSMVFGYISALVVDMAFYIKGETEEELPERLIVVSRCSHIQMDKAVPPP